MIHIIDEAYDDKHATTSRSTLNRAASDFISQDFNIMSQTNRVHKSRSQNRLNENPRMSAERGNRMPLSSKREERGENEQKLPSLSIRLQKVEETNRPNSGRKLNESGATMIELKKLLDPSSKKQGVDSQNHNFIKNFLIEEDYENVSSRQSRDDDKEQVKVLDRWRLEIQRKAILSSKDKRSEIKELYRQRKGIENSSNMAPVNSDALNKIMLDSGDDFYEPNGDNGTISALTTFRKKTTGFLLGDDSSYKGIEGSMIDNNNGLLMALIERKVQKELRVEDVQKMTIQQVRLQVKMITESVLMKFKALKKTVSETFVQNQVEKILKRLKSKPSRTEDASNSQFGGEESPKQQLEKGTIDYRMMELSLIKDYEQATIDIHNLSSRLTYLNHENFQLKRGLALAQDQVQQVNKVYKVLEAKYEENKSPKSVSPGNKNKARTPIVVDDPNIVDLAKLQKARHEKKRQEAAINDKIFDIQQKLNPVIQETELKENELKLARDSKAYFKMQLKDLYYQMLKDEKYIMESQSDSSCAWIIKNLWEIGEEVKPQAFPIFMDRHTIKFMLEYAKLQADIEKYCKQNNLLSMLASMDEFKHMHIRGQGQQGGKEAPEKQSVMLQSDLTPKILDIKPKTQDSLLEEFRNKMQVMKKENIKARRMVSMIQYNAKGRSVVSKWEDVDPFITNEQLMDHIRAHPMVESASPLKVPSEKFKTTKLDFSGIKSTNPSEVAQKMLNNLEAMRKAEINRIVKENVGVILDERLISTLNKTFRFMLGKREGAEAYRRFAKEKRVFEEKNMKSDQTHKKSHSQGRQQGSQALFSLLVMHPDKLADDMKSSEGFQKSEIFNRAPSRNGTMSIPPLKISNSSPLASERVKSQIGGMSSRPLRMADSIYK